MKKLFTFLLALIASVGIASAQSGTCGDNLTWELNAETGILTISGTGAMADYPSGASVPWYEYRSSIQSVIITDGVTSIGEGAFNSCFSLTSVTIPNSVTSIGDQAFLRCKSLTSITIPDSVTSIGKYAFYNCSSLTSVTIGNSVISIGERAFEECYSLTSVTIPNSVTSIGDRAFAVCSKLSSVTIPNGVTSIGVQAFYYCKSLTSVTIPNSVTSIGYAPFSDCSSLTSMNVDSNNPNYSSVDGVLFNKDKTTLIQYPIGNTRSEYIIPNSVTSIGEYAFSDCSSLTSVTIPNSVTSIGYAAFSDCSSLTSITIPNSVTSIGDWAFGHCSSLTSVTIPNSVTSIGYAAFSDCSSLTSINVDSNNPNYSSVNGVLFNKDKTTLVAYPGGKQGAYTIPNSVTSIGDAAFWGCSSLTSVTIGNSVTSIGFLAFSYCSSLTLVTIPNSVTSIGRDAFYNCYSLTSVTFEGSTPPVFSENVFYVAKECPIYVPCGTKDAYVAALNVKNTIDESRVIEKLPYTYSVLTSDSTLGSITITQEPTCTEPVIFRADAAEGYRFTQWSDGNTDNPRSLILTQDTTLKAEFELAQCLIASGYCGADSTNLTWELSCDSVLTISGTGAMADYAYNTMPWYDYRSSILSVVINDGVTKIGYEAFRGCSSLTSITIPNSVTSIGEWAFRDCYSLTSVTIGNSVTSIGDGAFYGCSSLTSITIPNSVISIGENAFCECSSLTSINVDSNNPNYSSVDGVLFNKDKTTLVAYSGGKQGAYTIPNSVTSIGSSAFEDCSSLTSITIPNSVTSIGNHAFSRCSSLTSVTIPNSVTSIEYYAFYYCSSLSSVTIPNSVTSIGSYAFYNCSSLTSVTIPNSVTSIGVQAFGDCSSLASVTISNGVKDIGYAAFDGCSSLTSVTIPNSVTGIGGGAFRECSSLTSVTIPNSVKGIDPDAFEDCSSLTSVTIPNSVTSIGSTAFSNCSSLASVSISNGVKSIEYGAFSHCSSLTSITIPNSVISIGNVAFGYCSSLTSVTIGNSVTSIGHSAFEDCSSLTSITFEGSTPPSIDRYVFDNTNNCPIYVPCGTKEAYLAALNVNNTIDESRVIEKTFIASGYCGADSTNLTWELSCDSVLTISGTGAMADYAYNTMPWYDYRSSIKSVIITDGVTNIGMFAFDNCNSLTSVTIPNSVISIGGRAFSGCSSLKSITIPNSVTSIGDVAFADCSSLTSITIPNSVTSIGNHAFYGCSSLTSVTIPNGVTSIGVFAFSGCSSLTSVTIPNSVTSIGDYAFSGCKSLASVTIGNSVTSIGNQAFENCTSLTSINVDSNNPNYSSVDGVLFNKDKTTLVACPGGKQGAYTIPNSVTSIGESAFYYCSSLTSVTIPNSVTTIGYDAFRHCTGLISITFEAPNPPSFTKFSFYDTNNCLFYVPCGTKDAYVAALIERDIDESRVIEKTFIASGTCGAQGDNLTWELSCDSVLTISGTGAMADYTYNSYAPWYDYRSSIKSVIITDGVTSIGQYAFYRCSKLTSVTIPNSVTSIGSQAFYYCSSLTSVTIPNSVTSIGEDAFRGCSSLTSVTIPNSVTSIGNYAFYNCSSLTSITIPNSVTSIGSHAFYGCSSLTSVTIPDSVTSIGSGAFYSCKSLTSVTIPNGVTSIGDGAFDGCSSLTSVTFESITPPIIKKGVHNTNNCPIYVPCGTKEAYVAALNENNTIDESRVIEKIFIASGYCGADSTNLTWELSCDSVLTISGTGAMADYAYASKIPWYGHRSAIKTILINDGVTSIGRSAFYDCSSLTSVTFEGRTPPSIDRDVFYNTNNCPIYVPCGTKDAYVTALNENNTIDESRVIEKTFIASSYCGAEGDNLTWELSCDSVLTISGTGAMEDYAYNTMPWYDYRSSILSVVISDGVTSIGNSAFRGCSSLTSITIPNSVTSIENYAFDGCSSLTSVTIGNSVTSIGNYTFYDCSSLTSVTIGNSVTSIGEYTFYKCSSLISVTIPNSVTSLGYAAFAGCSSLISVTIPNSVTSIGIGTFEGCSSLTSVTIPNSVTSIGERAFADCTSLTSVTIPSSVTSIDNYTFRSCSSLTSVTIGNSVTNIEWGAFYECSSLTSITIPNSVTSIGKYVFWNCSLTSMTIPNSVTSIEQGAFLGCSSLTSVTFEGRTPPSIDRDVFYNTNNCPIYVPCGTKEAYLTTLNVNNTIDESRVIEKLPYIYSVLTSDSTLGSVTITQEPTCTEPVIFRADAAEGYQFAQWSDGNTDNPRSLILTQDTTLKAEFELCTYTITWLNYDSLVLELDTNVAYGTMPSYDSAVPAKPSTAEYTYTFAGWSPEVVATTEDATYTATYTSALRTYSVLVYGMNDNIILNGTYPYGESVLVEAIPEQNYQFTQWSDGNTDNPRSLILTQDTILKALFEQIIIEQDTIIVKDSTDISDIITGGQDTIPYVEVQPGGEITIDRDDIGIGVITIITIGTESGQVHPWDGGYDNLKNTRVVMEYVLEPLKQQADPNKWYAFAVPFKVDIETGITRKYGNKSHVPGKDFMILEYDSELRSRTGSGWKEKKSGLLEPGHFYMLGIEGNCNRWLFEKVRDADVVGDKEKDLQHYAHGNSKNDGWHGLGNTTLEYVDMSFDGLNATYVYTYDNQYGRYNIYSIEELILAVGQPFFTQGDNDGSVAFTPNNGKGKGNGKKNMPIYAPSYDVQPSHPRVLLTIETEKINATPDRLYITLHDDNQCGSYRIGRDFMRMDKGSKQVPNFWCPMADGTQLSAHGISMPTTYTTIPLGIFTPAKGEYTINAHMQDMDDYIVELYYQNVCLGIVMQGVPFRLEMAAGTSYEYSIRISRRVSTDLNPAEDTQCDKDNKWYDVLGRPLPQDAHGIFIRKGEKIIK